MIARGLEGRRVGEPRVLFAFVALRHEDLREVLRKRLVELGSRNADKVYIRGLEEMTGISRGSHHWIWDNTMSGD